MRSDAKDLLLGITIFAVALGALLYIQYGPGEALQTSRDAQITFRSFPTVISALLMLLSAIFVAVSLIAQFRARSQSQFRGVEATRSGEPSNRPRFLLLRMTSLLILLIAYAMLLGAMPYYLLTALFLFALFFIFGETNPLKNALVAAAGGAAFHALFVTILHLPLY